MDELGQVSPVDSGSTLLIGCGELLRTPMAIWISDRTNPSSTNMV
jgi:hypothetical protein